MKKLLAFALAVIMLCSLCVGCVDDDSPEAQLEQAIKDSEAAKKAADAAQKQYDDLLDAISDYEDALAELEKYN